MMTRILLVILALGVVLSVTDIPSVAQTPLGIAIQLDPAAGPDTDRLRVTVVADGLPYATGMQLAPDGSLLVATSTPRRAHFNRSTAAILAFRDDDGDGAADGPGRTVAEGLPGGAVAMRLAGSLLVLTTWGQRTSSFEFLRHSPADGHWTPAGALDLHYPEDHLHDTYGLEVAGGPDPGTFHIYFNVGSRYDALADSTRVPTSGLWEGALSPESLQRMTILDDGSTIRVLEMRTIATGLRNAAALALDPVSGDLVISDNGFGIPDSEGQVASADELQVIDATALGVDVHDFGFPDAYVDQRTGETVGDRGSAPSIAFSQDTGTVARGIAGLAFAPSAFPEGLDTGLFVSFHGDWSAAGLDNPANPVLHVRLDTRTVTSFISNQAAGVGHLDTILATADALYLSDINRAGGMGDPDPDGVIHRVAAMP